jgi:hypothetical protein
MGRRERRSGRLLVDVPALSGRSYPAGTVVQLVGTGSGVDAWAGSEWIPLRWWEFAELGSPTAREDRGADEKADEPP